MTGTERKVFQKYYPPDFDPSKIPRGKGRGSRQFVQRVMTPFNMQCNTCSEYIYKGKKFNMKRETAEGEFYLGLKIFRFYFKCPNCLAEISFKTDLEHCDYQAENGATRLFEAFKLYQDAEKAREAKEEEDAKDPMKMLEKRTKMSRAEMEAIGKLEELQEINRKLEATDVIGYLEQTDQRLSIAEQLKRQEEADEDLIRQLYGKNSEGRIERRIKEEEDGDEDVKPGTSLLGMKKPIPRLEAKPVVKRENDQKALLSKIGVKKKTIKKEVKEEPLDSYEPGTSQSSSGPPPAKVGVLSGLADYGSGSDSD